MIGKENKGGDTDVNILIATAKNDKTTRQLLLLLITSAVLLSILIILSIYYTDTKNNAEYYPVDRSGTLPTEARSHNPSISLSFFEEYQKSLEPRLSKIALSNNSSQTSNIYASEAQRLMSWFKDQLIYSEQTNEPIEALSLKNKIDEAEELINKVEKLLKSHFQQIESAYSTRNYNDAIKYLESAENLSSEDERIIEWRKELKNSHQFFSQSELLRSAIAMNDSESELRALETIHKLGKLDGKQRERRIYLIEFFKNQESNQLLGNARTLRDAGNFEEALAKLQKAQALSGDTDSIKSLKSEIIVKRDITLAKQWKKKALASASIDDWQSVLLYFKNAQQLTRPDQEVIEGIKLSENILEKTKQLEALKENPMRLADREVESFARTILAESIMLRDKSKRLSALHKEVLTLVDTTLQPRPVIIKSDGKTRIEIKGIGFIEATEKRTIHLKPGSYLVHAACAGHKTEITELKIPLQGSIDPKRIICGERI